MTSRTIKLAPVLFLALLTAGCGPDCESLCEDQKACPGESKSTDCNAQCDELDNLAEKAACGDQWDNVVACESDQDDICKPDESACESENKAYLACLEKYCGETEARANACAKALS